MERFAIKIDKAVKSKLKNLCRLCGIDNPNQVDILGEEEFIIVDDDDEVSLSRKIFECVGIQVLKNDRMPQRICCICVDKINDFHEYRQMCMATNAQTRKLLSLPPEQPKKATKKVTIKTETKDAESIFGIIGEDSAMKIESANKTTKKTKKSSATVTFDESTIRSLTQQEIEMALKLEEAKQEAKDDDWSANRPKSKRVKKPSAKSAATTLLLAPKELNQRERKREIEQKKMEKKRKSDDVKKPPPIKKVKKEQIGDCTIYCNICRNDFTDSVSLYKHINLEHLPSIAPFGCSSCKETFVTAEEKTIHHKWHQTAGVRYNCVLCAASFEKMITFHRHVAACTKALSASFIVKDNINCDMCNFAFETQNLYEWHDCFINKNAPCPKCGRVFTKKAILFKHLFKCSGIAAGTSGVSVTIPKPTTSSKKRSMKSKTDIISTVKSEPEAIIETSFNDDGVFDDDYMDTHFGDSDTDFGMNDSITASTKTQIHVPDQNLQTSRTRKQKTSTNIAKKSTKNPIIIQNMANCVVKLEPIDMSQYIVNEVTADDTEQMESIAANDEIPVNQPIEPLPPTVPPLTIRIKKEKMNTGYGDFDAELARNIKKERTDETWELVGDSSSSSSVSRANPSQQRIEMESNKTKPKKLYKKPALLAIKIKQERIERENEESAEGYYHDFSIPAVEMQVDPQPAPSIENLLPIITQIHSVLEPHTIPSIETNEHTRMLPNPFSGARQLNQIAAETIPFKPLHIVKQERLSPPLLESIDEIPDSTFTEPTDMFAGSDEYSEIPCEEDLHNCVPIAMHIESSINSEETPKKPEDIDVKCDEINDSIVESMEVGSTITEAEICESATISNSSEPEINNSESSSDAKDGNDVEAVDEAQRENVFEINESQMVSVVNTALETKTETNSSDLQIESNDKIDLKVQAEQKDNGSEFSSQSDSNEANEFLEIGDSAKTPNTDENIETAIAEDATCESEQKANDPAPQINDFATSLHATDENNVIRKDEEISLEALESGDLIDDDANLLLDGSITEDSLLDSNPDSLLLSKDVHILEAVKDVLNTSSLDALNDGDSSLNFIDRLVDKAAEEIIGDDKNEHLDDLNDLIENTTPFIDPNGMDTGIDGTQPCTSSESTNGNGMELSMGKSADNDDILGLNIDYDELLPSVAESTTEILPQILNTVGENDSSNQGDSNTQPNFESLI